MKKRVRTLLVIFLAIFVMGSMINTVSASMMTIKMTSSDPGNLDMPGCELCISGSDQGMSMTCVSICVVPVALTIETNSLVMPVPGKYLANANMSTNFNHITLLEPHPPRTSLLII